MYYHYTGNACRSKVCRQLCKLYDNPYSARSELRQSQQSHTHPKSNDSVPVASRQAQVRRQPLIATYPVTLSSSVPRSSVFSVEQIDTLYSQVKHLPIDKQVALIQDIYHDICLHQELYVPKDFISLSMQAMQTLHASGRSNVLYELSLGLGTSRPDGSGSLFPTNRMPMGLLEYMVNFFASETMNQVRYSVVNLKY